MINNPNPKTVVVEHKTVQPVIERNTIIERTDAWYSEPWGIALIIALIAVLGMAIYFVGFNPSNSAPVVNSTTTRIEKDVTNPSGSSTTTPVIVNTPPATNVTTTAPSSPSTPPVVINNTAPATPKSDSPGASNSSTNSSDHSSSDTNSSDSDSNSNPSSNSSGQ